MRKQTKHFRAILTKDLGFQMVIMVKNPPANAGDRETQIRSLGWEDPQEEDMATHSNILAWRNPMDRRAWWAVVHGFAKSQTQLSN